MLRTHRLMAGGHPELQKLLNSSNSARGQKPEDASTTPPPVTDCVASAAK
jgi:hypothetical protein